MILNFEGYNNIGDYVPINQKSKQINYNYDLASPYYSNLYRYPSLKYYGNHINQSQPNYNSIQNFSNLQSNILNKSTIDPSYKPTAEKKTPDEPLDEPGSINLESYLRRRIRIKNKRWREFLAELLGTFILCSFIYGGIAQYKFLSRINQAVSYFSASASSAVGVILGIIIVGKVSGGHLNPAISFAIYLMGRMTAKRMFIYWAAQFIGGFIATIIIYIVYFDTLASFGSGFGGINTGGIFATFPITDLSIGIGFFDQMIGTFFLILIVLATTDNRNMNLPLEVFAFIIGLALLGIANTFGFNSGYAVNPARDFPARLFLLMANWGPQVFSTGSFFFWIPLIAPFVGSLLAALVYIFFISAHWFEDIQKRTQPHLKSGFNV